VTASIVEHGWLRPLTENPILRLVTVFVFYIFQGVPMGMFYIAIPAYMAGEGASPANIAAVVSAFSLPWTLKLVNGFFMDRYTFLPMGRRRIWLLGAQSTMVIGLLVGAVLDPGARDVALLSALALAISAATTFQDVSIDSLVVDIMEEKDQAKAGGIMFGAQIFGMAGATAVCGFLLDKYGAAAAFGTAALFLSAGLVFAVMLRERPGERRLPWSVGDAHPRNLEIKIDAWPPLLKLSLKAIFSPASLLIIPFLLVRNVPGGANDVFNPLLSAQYVGWSTSQYTAAASAAQLGAGVIGLTLGGFLTARLGSRTMLAILFTTFAAHYAFIGFMRGSWDQGWVAYEVLWATESLGILVAIAVIPLAMQVCNPAVAATQFTIYMALANFGRPIGAWIAALQLEGDPRRLHYTVAAIMAVAAVGTLFMSKRRASAEVELKLAHGAGAGAAEN
jgi:MFS transporter, PAT family, beta-lactamase induction signal transducer AmpG